MNGLVASTLSFLRPKTDEEAMCRVKSHDDEQEFARLMKRWDEPIRRLCARMTGDLHRGEDLKQDTFLRLFEKRKDYQPTARFSTFLWRIALNLCYDELRRQQRRRELLSHPQPESDAHDPEGSSLETAAEGLGPDQHTVQLEEGELVRQALLQLPDIYRTVVILRHYQDLKLARIAEILEIPEGTVNSRMAEALSRLSRLLEPKLKDNLRLRLEAPNDSATAKTSSRKRHLDGQSPITEQQSPVTNYQFSAL